MARTDFLQRNQDLFLPPLQVAGQKGSYRHG
jgi:hypothetical protein